MAGTRDHETEKKDETKRKDGKAEWIKTLEKELDIKPKKQQGGQPNGRNNRKKHGKSDRKRPQTRGR